MATGRETLVEPLIRTFPIKDTSLNRILIKDDSAGCIKPARCQG